MRPGQWAVNRQWSATDGSAREHGKMSVPGWSVACPPVIPPTMGATGDGAGIGWSGGEMLTVGVAVVGFGVRSRNVGLR